MVQIHQSRHKIAQSRLMIQMVQICQNGDNIAQSVQIPKSRLMAQTVEIRQSRHSILEGSNTSEWS